MRKDIIEKQLTNWFSLMLQKYAWLNIKYEYSNVEKCFLVSFSPSLLTKVSEGFSKDALDFENKMNDDYDIDAPLFCDGEELFKLSPEATILSAPNVSTFTCELSADSAKFDLNETTVSQITVNEEYAEGFYYANQKYDMAA